MKKDKKQIEIESIIIDQYKELYSIEIIDFLKRNINNKIKRSGNIIIAYREVEETDEDFENRKKRIIESYSHSIKIHQSLINEYQRKIDDIENDSEG